MNIFGLAGGQSMQCENMLPTDLFRWRDVDYRQIDSLNPPGLLKIQID